MKTKSIRILLSLWLAVIFAQSATAGTPFVYDGTLSNRVITVVSGNSITNYVPANGQFDFTGGFYDAVTNGNSLDGGGMWFDSIAVANGQFTLTFDQTPDTAGRAGPQPERPNEICSDGRRNPTTPNRPAP